MTCEERKNKVAVLSNWTAKLFIKSACYLTSCEQLTRKTLWLKKKTMILKHWSNQTQLWAKGQKLFSWTLYTCLLCYLQQANTVKSISFTEIYGDPINNCFTKVTFSKFAPNKQQNASHVSSLAMYTFIYQSPRLALHSYCCNVILHLNDAALYYSHQVQHLSNFFFN